METQFRRDDLFKYKTNVQNLPCAEQNLSTVECFATYREGYCQYYATTMAIFLREQGIPARIAEGFLPGNRDERTGIETLLGRQRHQWVEVYFPGYGWVPFDPTGGDVSQLEPLPTGAPLASGSPRPSSNVGPGGTAFPTRDPRNEGPNGVGSVRSGGGPSAGLLGAFAVLLAAAVGGLMFMTWRRGPRGETSPDRAYGSVTRLAADSASARGPTRPSTNTPAPWPRSCPRHGRSSRRSPRPRWSRRTAEASSATTACTRCAKPSGACGSCCSACSSAGTVALVADRP